jgi:AbrB family looped-hinge helix DNA binding protein
MMHSKRYTAETMVETSTISPKYQIVIPLAVRKALKLKPGQKVVVTEKEGKIELTPVRQLSELEGVFKGRELDFEREADRI